jgi:MFS family permease
MITTLLLGFSVNLPMAIVARGLAGAGNGNVGIIRTTVAEMVPFKELQPRAFSLMPLVWNTGSIFGPMIGGILANPYNIGPRENIEHPNLLQRFPYALPNIVSACFFLVGISTGILFLEETLETVRGRRDYGLDVGRKLVNVVKSHTLRLGELAHLRSKDDTKGKNLLDISYHLQTTAWAGSRILRHRALHYAIAKEAAVAAVYVFARRSTQHSAWCSIN